MSIAIQVLRSKSSDKLTTASLLKVVAAIGELETSVVAVARLIARAFDNRVR